MIDTKTLESKMIDSKLYSMIETLEKIVKMIDILTQDEIKTTSPILHLKDVALKAIVKIKLLLAFREKRPDAHKLVITFFSDESVGITLDIDAFELYDSSGQVLEYKESDESIVDWLFEASRNSKSQYYCLVENAKMFDVKEVSIDDLFESYYRAQRY